MSSMFARKLLKPVTASFTRSFSVGQGKIGFIGLGNMGGHMAQNLVKKGEELVVFDVSAENVQRLVDVGATSVSSPAEVAKQCTTVITMLPSSPHVKKVYLDPEEGLISSAQPGSLFIDSSTIDPASAQEVAAEMKTQTASQMVDAPVSGGVGGAENGTLTFMVGGEEGDFKKASQLLELMGHNLVHCGDAGTGQVAKVCNNLLLAISMVGVSEAMNLGVKSGMDPKKLAGIINTSSGQCWSSSVYNPTPGVMPNVPASNNYEGGFGVDLMKKDLGLAMQAATDADAELPLGKLTDQIYADISKAGYGGRDFSYVYQHLDTKK